MLNSGSRAASIRLVSIKTVSGVFKTAAVGGVTGTKPEDGVVGSGLVVPEPPPEGEDGFCVGGTELGTGLEPEEPPPPLLQAESTKEKTQYKHAQCNRFFIIKNPRKYSATQVL